MRTSVLLKTAVAPVWSGNISMDTNVLFDEDAQRYFLTEHLAKKLNLKIEGIEVVHLSAFGEDNTSTRELRTTTVFIETENSRKIPIEVLIVPTIAVPIHNHMRYINRNMDYLKGLRLAHPVTKDDYFEISLLIGADHYWDFIEDKVIRGDGPIAMKSKLGYLLSGPLQPGRVLSSTTSSILNVLVSNKSEEFGLEEIIKEQTRCQIIERVEEAEPTGKISKDGLNDTYLLNCCDLLWTVTKIFDLLTYFQKPIT